MTHPLRSPATPHTARAVGDRSSAGASSLASENMMYPMETIETFAPAPPGTHPPLDSPDYRSTHLRHPNHDPLGSTPASSTAASSAARCSARAPSPTPTPT